MFPSFIVLVGSIIYALLGDGKKQLVKGVTMTQRTFWPPTNSFSNVDNSLVTEINGGLTSCVSPLLISVMELATSSCTPVMWALWCR